MKNVKTVTRRTLMPYVRGGKACPSRTVSVSLTCLCGKRLLQSIDDSGLSLIN